MTEKKITISDYYYKKTEIDTMINGKANTSHTHTTSEITDFPVIPDVSNYIQKSPITGFVKNDGSIDSIPKGDKGDTGPQGPKGDAFTFEDFTPEQLASLKGPKGDTGAQGPQGEKGDKGDKGDPGTITIDTSLSTTSTNAVQNKVITGALNGKADSSSLSTVATSGSYTDLSNKPSTFPPSNHTHLSSDVTDLIDVIYPVGSIYMSVNSTNPSTLFGGTWEQLKDRFLLGSGDTYNNGATGGSATVKLTANQSGLRSHGHGMTHTHSHHHSLTNFSSGQGSKEGYTLSPNRSSKSRNTTTDATASSKSTTDTNTALDAGEAHNNMPPYIVVNVWKRTA